MPVIAVDYRISDNPTGDYLFVPYINKNGGNDNRFGYPVKFSFVHRGDIIVDNDQKNADTNTRNDSPTEPTYNGNDNGTKVPGYFLTADLFAGRSNAFAQWKPQHSGEYEIYVHVPEYGATATGVRYVIKEDGTNQNQVFSRAIDQSTHPGQWVRITTNNNDTFQFTDQGYIGIHLGSNSGSRNYSISRAQKVAFDAVKFIHVGGNTPPNPEPSPGNCTNSINLNQTVSGNWTVGCSSTHHSGSYAKYYTFNLSRRQQVTINLQSTSADAYMILLNGSGNNGSIIERDDDDGGNRNSQITRTLSPGTYTIEATTYNQRRTGRFSLSLTTDNNTPEPNPEPSPGNCTNSINLNQRIQGYWDIACTDSRIERCVNYYTFHVPQRQRVTINLESSYVDTIMGLFTGSGTDLREQVAADDNGGNGTNARIVRILSTGTYTIVATTKNPYTTGRFTLSVATD